MRRIRSWPLFAVFALVLLALGAGGVASGQLPAPTVTAIPSPSVPTPIVTPPTLSTGRLPAVKPAAPIIPPTIPTCPAPDLATCQSEGYGSSYCGAVTHKARCVGLIRAEHDRQKAGPEGAVLPAARWAPAGKRVHGLPAAYDDFDVTGMTNLAAGDQQRTRLSALRAAQVLVKGFWHANGIKVESCSEYAHEKLWDYTNLEDRHADKLEPRAYFDAVSTALAAMGPPKAKDGTPFAFTWPSGTPRNRYYQPVSTYYPPGTTTRYAIRASVLAWIDARGRSEAAPRDLAWHRAMAASLRAESDDTLDRMQARQLEFDELLARRAAIEARFTRPPMGAPAPTQAEKDLAARTLAGLDGELEAYLIQAKVDGCLEYARATRCDWSPRLFAEAFSQALAARKQDALRVCARVIGKAWGPTDPIMTTIVRSPVQCRGCVQGTAQVDAFIAQAQQTLAAVRTKTAADGTKYVSEVDGDDVHWGNRWIGAGYDYDFGWEAKGFAGAGARECDVGLRAWGSASAHVNLLKQPRFKIVEASAELRTDAAAWNGAVRTRLLGVDWYTKREVAANIAAGDEWQRQKQLARVTIPVFGIPIKIEAGVAGSIGYEATVAPGALRRSCADASRTAIGGVMRFEPYARLSGYVEVGVDFEIAEAGVAVDVTVLRKSLPFRARFGVAPVTGGGLALEADTRLDYRVSTLDGHVYLYVDYVADEYRKTLFRWAGTASNTNLWSTPLNAPMAQLR